MYESVEMRTVLAEALDAEMAANERVCVLDADLARANGTLFLLEKYPQRMIDVGIAEANMACVAAGLASYGFQPFIFSFCPFITRRICDQAAISIAYAKQNVKLVGTDPGITAELNGGTHMSVEDIGVMRSIPGMVIYEPLDGDQLAKAMPQIFRHDGPVYIRLFRKVPARSFCNREDYVFDLFRADVVRCGKDVTLFGSGIMIGQAMEAADILAEQGIAAEVIDVHTIKPLDVETVVASVRKTGCAVSCENHNTEGGLGSALAGCLAKNHPAPMEYIGIRDHFSEVGRMPYLLGEFKMSAKHIADAALKVIVRKNVQ